MPAHLQQLMLDVNRALPAAGQQQGQASVTAADLAPILSSMGYDTVLRTALGGGCTVSCLTNLRHTFLVCIPSGK